LTKIQKNQANPKFFDFARFSRSCDNLWLSCPYYPGLYPFCFPDITTHINAFVFFGDASRFWLALLIFIPEFNNTNISTRFASKKVWLLIGALLSILSLMATLNPGIFPAVKFADGRDMYFSILFKVITLIILGIVILKFYASYHIKPNFSVLSLIVGNILIFQTVIIFMISRPWSSMWWLAHNLFLLSYITIGIGIALYPNDGFTTDDLIVISDKKMYQVKNYH